MAGFCHATVVNGLLPWRVVTRALKPVTKISVMLALYVPVTMSPLATVTSPTASSRGGIANAVSASSAKASAPTAR